MRRYTFAPTTLSQVDFAANAIGEAVTQRFVNPVVALAIAADSFARSAFVEVIEAAGHIAIGLELHDGAPLFFPAPVSEVRIRQIVPSSRPLTVVAAEACTPLALLPTERVGVVRRTWIETFTGAGEVIHNFAIPRTRTAPRIGVIRGAMLVTSGAGEDLVLELGMYSAELGRIVQYGTRIEYAPADPWDTASVGLGMSGPAFEFDDGDGRADGFSMLLTAIGALSVTITVECGLADDGYPLGGA